MFTAASVFSATNLDDIVILTLLFSRLDDELRPLHVIGGQLLGFSLLVLVSSAALFARLLVPPAWLGLLGLLPISLGVSSLLESLAAVGPGPPAPVADAPLTVLPLGRPAEVAPAVGGRVWAPLVGVTLLTVANGSDNIGVYLPLFARSSAAELAITLITFALGLACWCLLAWRLTRLPGLAQGLGRQAGWLVPAVLIALGALVLLDSHCLQEPLPALICLGCLVVMSQSVLRQLERLQPVSPLAGAAALPGANPSPHSRV